MQLESTNRSVGAPHALNAVFDAKFVPDSFYIASRDRQTVKLWDVRRASDSAGHCSPVYSAQVMDYLKSKPTQQLETLSDQFFIDVTPDGRHLATGGYHRSGHVIDLDATTNTRVSCVFGEKRDTPTGTVAAYGPGKRLSGRESLEPKKRVQFGCWSPFSRSLGSQS